MIKKKICNDFTLYFPMCHLYVTQPFILILPYPHVLLNLFFLILKVLRYQINKKTFVYGFFYHFLISQLITEIDKIICNDNASWLPKRTSSLSYNLIGEWFMVWMRSENTPLPVTHSRPNSDWTVIVKAYHVIAYKQASFTSLTLQFLELSRHDRKIHLPFVAK